MTRTISFITATVGAALLFAVPAYGDNWAADARSDSVGYLSPDSADRAAALEQRQLARMLDAREASQTAKFEAQLAAANAASSDSGVVVDDRFDLHSQTAPATVAATTSGRELDLRQVGLGVGLGLLLALGLSLGVRLTRVHRLAH
jgi:hypothetical protein